MKEKRTYHSLKDFYPYYLKEHSKKGTRTLHFIGTALVLITTVFILYTKKWKGLLLLPILGYGFAWISHIFIEKNKPATFKYPMYSLLSDFIMFWHILTGQIDKKLENANRKD